MRKIKINHLYRHFKGDLYIVTDVAIDTETWQEVVIYKGIYGNCPLYVRPIDSFLSEVDHKKYPNVKQKYRFQETKIESVRK